MSDTKKVTLPSGLVVEFRRPGPLTDIEAVGGVPALASRPFSDFVEATEDGQETAVVRTLGDAARDAVFVAEKLAICSIRPKFTRKTPVEKGRRHFDTLSKIDFDALIAAFSAVDQSREEADQLSPLSGTGTPSSSSMPSEPSTESTPQASSPTN